MGKMRRMRTEEEDTQGSGMETMEIFVNERNVTQYGRGRRIVVDYELNI